MQGVKKRTHNQVLADALQVLKRREKGEKVEAVNGVKLPTPLLMF